MLITDHQIVELNTLTDPLGLFAPEPSRLLPAQGDNDVMNGAINLGDVPMRLLLAEDDAMIAETVAGAMRQSGYAVDWAPDGRIAKLSLGNGVCDIVLLDHGLPTQDGLRLLKRYRKEGGAASVIIVTGLMRQTIVSKAWMLALTTISSSHSI